MPNKRRKDIRNVDDPSAELEDHGLSGSGDSHSNSQYPSGFGNTLGVG